MARTALLIGGGGTTGAMIAHGLREQGFDVTILHRGVHEPPEISDFPHIHADPHFAEPVLAALGPASFDLVVATYGRVATLAPIFSGRCQRFISVGGIPIYAGYLEPGEVRPVGMRLLSREDGPLADPDAIRTAGAARFAGKMRAAEDAVMHEDARGGYAASIFRYPVVYGPRGISLGDWSVIKRARDGRPFILLPNEGLGIITRCAAANCAHAVLLSVDCDAARGVIFNLADDDQYTLGQWTEMMLDLLGSDMEIIGLPPMLNWAASHLIPLAGTTSAHAIVDASRARDLLGYKDLVSARDGMAQMVAWRLQNPPDAAAAHAWDDPFDYALEDDVARRLRDFRQSCGDIEQARTPIHPYPHPKDPSLTVDHRGR